jgi:hypothetical protein
MFQRFRFFAAYSLLFSLALPRAVMGQAGISIWTNKYCPAGINVSITGMAVSPKGDVWVTGYSHDGMSTNWNYHTVAYSSLGLPRWTNIYNGRSEDVAFSVAADTNGFAYVTGRSSVTNRGYDFATVKYSPNGSALWTNLFHGGYLHDEGRAVAVDSEGKVWVTGTSDDINGPGLLTIQYSSTGTLLRGQRTSDAEPRALATDNFGNCFVCGFTTGSGTDYLLLRYDTNGTYWSRTYNRGSSDAANALVADQNGDAIITGGAGGDIVTIKYSSAGTTLWTNRYAGPGNGSDDASAIAIDGNGNVVVVGTSQETSFAFSKTDMVMMKYSSAGVPLWTNRYGVASQSDAASTVAVDSAGNIFVGVYFGTQSLTVAYSPSGIPLWTNWSSGLLRTDKEGNLYVAGSGFQTTKYSSFNPSPVPISVARTPAGLIVSWPDSRFRLQSAPSLTNQFIDVGGANPWTNLFQGERLFFRLISD